jgi:multidrug resistance efflux pump
MSTPSTTPTPPHPLPTTNGAAPTTPPPHKLKRSTRISLIVILIMTLTAATGYTTSYFLNARNYVSTDNAQIDGNQIMINAPATGTLLDWNGTQGTLIHQHQTLGRIEIQNAFAQPQMPIRAPGAGTIAIDNTVPGEYVTTGTPLALAYDLNKIYITARIDDTAIKPIHPGQPVDIDIDAYPHTPITGHVQEIQAGAAAVFSLFPQSNTQGTGNFQKVTQVIPVKISLNNLNNLNLAPGMNVTVHIHKQ